MYFESIKNKVDYVLDFSNILFYLQGLTRLMAENRSYDILALAWKRWRDVPKGEMKALYEEFVQLSNEGVRGSFKTF